MFVVGRGSYLWLSASLFQIAVHCCLYLSLSSLIQPPLWLANVEMDMASTPLFVFLLQFFRGSLDLRRNFPFSMVLSGGYRLLSADGGFECWFLINLSKCAYLDLVAYPPDRTGSGIIKLSYLIPPFAASARFRNIVFSLVATRQQLREISDDFLLTAALAVPHYRSNLFCFWVFWQAWMVISAVVGFLMLAMFITFGFAVAQQLNDMKNLALNSR